MYDSADNKARYAAYTKLQATATAYGEKLPIPEIVAIGGQSDGKSSLLEAFLGFRFNVREVEMGTRRPLMLQMVHNPDATEPRVCLQDEDADSYGPTIMPETAIATQIKQRTDALLKKLGNVAVSSKPIVMKAEFAYCPNITIIDTPGFILKARQGEPETTPDDILHMVKELAAPPNRIILFLQQSSVEWCSSLWLHVVQQVDPSLQRTLLVASKFDNRLKEFSSRWEVDRYLSASGFLPAGVRPFFVALPKERGELPGEAFRAAVQATDAATLKTLRTAIDGGFDEVVYGDRVGFAHLRQHLEAELARRYRDAAPAILSLLEQRAAAAAAALAAVDARVAAAGDVAAQRAIAMTWTASVLQHVRAVLDGASDPDPSTFGHTTEEERAHCGVGPWPGLVGRSVRPPHASLRLHGGAAFERTVAELQAAVLALEFPAASREKVANVLLGRGGRGGGGAGAVGAVAEDIARAAVQAAMGPLLEVACDRLAFVLRRLFELALLRRRDEEAAAGGAGAAGGPGSVPTPFQTTLRRAHDRFVADLASRCKDLLKHHLTTATSPYAMNAAFFQSPAGLPAPPAVSFSFTDNDDESSQRTPLVKPREPFVEMDLNAEPESNPTTATVARATETSRNVPAVPAFGGSQSVVAETPSPIQGGGEQAAARRAEMAAAAGAPPSPAVTRPTKQRRTGRENEQPGNHANGASKTGDKGYNQMCASAEQLFDRIRRHLAHDVLPLALHTGLLAPCREALPQALSLELFACSDADFLDKFAVAGELETLKQQRVGLASRAAMMSDSQREFEAVAHML